MDLNEEAFVLRNIPMFSSLDSSKLKLLAFASDEMTFEAGEELFRSGDAADCAYVVLDGEVDIVIDLTSDNQVSLVRGKNELIGEMGIISNAPRSATVRARTTVKALRISAELFIKLLRENADLALSVMRQLSHKLAVATQEIGEAALSK